MTLPISPASISLNQVNVELGLAGTTAISMNQASVRTLFGVASGTISMSDGYGKSNSFTFTLAAGSNLNLRTAAVAAGWDGVVQVICNVSSGTTISSTSTGSYALTINGSFPAGVRLNNAGIIIGRGGDGGAGASSVGGNVAGSPGTSAGPAVLVSVPVSINNTGSLFGGGGGGGGSGGSSVGGRSTQYYSGSGGGGGRGVGNGGAAGAGGSSPVGTAGTAGTLTTFGTGGIARTADVAGITRNWGAGGNGGAAGSSGSTAGSNTSLDTTGGPGAGGAAGAYLAGNANVTWVATGTRAGGVS